MLRLAGLWEAMSAVSMNPCWPSRSKKVSPRSTIRSPSRSGPAGAAAVPTVLRWRLCPGPITRPPWVPVVPVAVALAVQAAPRPFQAVVLHLLQLMVVVVVRSIPVLVLLGVLCVPVAHLTAHRLFKRKRDELNAARMKAHSSDTQK